ncbi:hypothetical protein, partial [Thiomicrorhabdus heinhorstiae]
MKKLLFYSSRKLNVKGNPRVENILNRLELLSKKFDVSVAVPEDGAAEVLEELDVQVIFYNRKKTFKKICRLFLNILQLRPLQFGFFAGNVDVSSYDIVVYDTVRVYELS